MFQTVSESTLRGTRLPEKDNPLIRTRVVNSIREVGKQAWNACFEDEVEDFDCLLAIEEAGIEGFAWRYVTVIENGTVVAAMPAFITSYQLETTLEPGPLRRFIRRMRGFLPGILTLKLACLGSPCTETGKPGFCANVPPERQPDLLARLIAGFEKHADDEGCSLRGVKDIPEPCASAFAPVFAQSGFASIPGLPTACLDIDFHSIESYLSRLSSGTRKDMRRKLKSFDRIRIETRTELADVMPRVLALYNATRNRSEWQFEALTAGYFAGILDRMSGKSFCTLYFAEDKLLAANILVHNESTLIDKFFCMDGEEGRAYDLYYLSWFANLRYCIEHHVARYQSGQAYYENKLRLGSRLTANTMYFKHRNRGIQWLLRLVSPMFGVDEPQGAAS
ncbi:peptidogalycan biosysnthesis protein [Phyllobacterium sp. P5_D12]